MPTLALVQHWRTDPTGKVGSAVMLGFAGLAVWRWQHSGLLFFALVCLRDLTAAWFLLTRRPDQIRTRERGVAALAYVSSAMPLMYAGGVSHSVLSDVLSILGFALATIALLELGRSFGVAPANRGHVRSGVYRYVSHPMYLGYALSELGMCLVNPVNVAVFVFSGALYVSRALLEQRKLRVA